MTTKAEYYKIQRLNTSKSIQYNCSGVGDDDSVDTYNTRNIGKRTMIRSRKAALLLAGSSHDWQLLSVAPATHRILFPTRLWRRCACPSFVYGEPLSARESLCDSLRRHPFAQLRSYTIIRNDIFSRSRPAGAGFTMSLLLHAKPALIHHVCGPRPTRRRDQCIGTRCCRSPLKLACCVSCNSSRNPYAIILANSCFR